MSNILAATIEVQQEEIAELREQQHQLEEEVRSLVHRISAIDDVLDSAGVPESKNERYNGRGEIESADSMSIVERAQWMAGRCSKADALRQQLATVTALVPEVDFFDSANTALGEWAAFLESCDEDEHEIRAYRAYAQDAQHYAARIRAWREGDGDGEGEKCCNDDYCRCGHHMEAHQYLVLADDDETVISSDACGVCDCQSFEQREEREGESDGD